MPKRVVVTHDMRVIPGPSGRWINHGPTGGEFFGRYLEIFDEVIVLCRHKNVQSSTETPPKQGQAIGDDRVKVLPIPDFKGVPSLRTLSAVRRTVVELCTSDTFWILRSGTTASVVGIQLMLLQQPYAVEVVADLRLFHRSRLLSPILHRIAKLVAKGAVAVSYVHRPSLMPLYPGRPDAVIGEYSSVDLPSRVFRDAPRDLAGRHAKRVRLITAGVLEPRKRVHVIVEALKELRNRGYDVVLEVCGDGAERNRLEAMTQYLGVAGSVSFHGNLSRKNLLGRLNEADIFVFASEAEGLPRAILEAMAKGLPCVAVSIPGTQALLDDIQLVNKCQGCEIANKVELFLKEPLLYAVLSKRNLDAARGFEAQRIRDARTEFYRNFVQRCRPNAG